MRGFAFQVTDDDVMNVLLRYSTDLVNPTDESLPTLCARVFESLDNSDFAEIESEAVNGGDEMDDQVDAAYLCMANILRQRGFLR